jgi:glycosyltransferase involved in cell wall biosynthesis
MKILILTPRFPYPLIGGDKIRIYRICKKLREEGYDLTLFSFVANKKERKFIQHPDIQSVFSEIQTFFLPRWQSYFNSFVAIFRKTPLQINYYRSWKMAKSVERELSSGYYYAVLVHLIRMAPYVIEQDNIKKVLEMTDAISLNYARNKEQKIRSLLGVIYRFEEKRVKQYEQECIRKFDFSVVVSPNDKNYLLKEYISPALENKIKIIPHGALEERILEPRKKYDPNLIIFIGNLRTLQNTDAALYFIEDIYPLVKKERPSARLRIIGDSPSRKIKSFNGKLNIEVTDRVDNIVDYAKDACISVCPIRIGAGVQGKILESMVMGVPVVATLMSANGIYQVIPGKHLLCSDNPREFADYIINLMRNKDLRNKLAKDGYEFVKEKFLYGNLVKEYPALFSK